MQQLDPKAVWFFFFSSSISLLFLILLGTSSVLMWVADISASFGEGSDTLTSDSTILLLLLALLILGIGYIWARLTYHFYRYELREDGFRKEHGIIWKKYVTIPYERIQNVDIYRGIIARIFGLSDLQVQTAGGITAGSYGAFSEGRLPGLSREVAEQIRDELVRRARGARSNQGL